VEFDPEKSDPFFGVGSTNLSECGNKYMAIMVPAVWDQGESFIIYHKKAVKRLDDALQPSVF
jgi:hypothetical protein